MIVTHDVAPSASAGAVRRATLVGALAIVLWASLATLTQAVGRVPPFELAALTFAIGGGVGAATWPVRQGALASLKQPPVVWALGVTGLFGYHALYFFALYLAPPAEASLINYLWPLFIVVFAGLLPGERLRLRHVVGALMGLLGTVVLIAGRGLEQLDARGMAGCAAAVGAALVWATYSVLSRRFAAVPSDAVAGFCLVTALLSAVAHVVFETSVAPASWPAVVALGLGPVGAAFYVWDHGMKRGDIKTLGVLSYATPVLSTLVLIAAGYASPTVALALACVCIVGGAVIASRRPREAIDALQ